MSELPQSSYGLSRVEIPVVGTYGWQVRMQRGRCKTSRFFADRSYGGVTAAHAAALEWRDATLAAWSVSEQARTCSVSARNASGVVGVCRIRVRSSQGMEYEFWQATWCPTPGVRKAVRFSILRHGDAAAYQLAIEARTRGVGA